MKRTKKDKKTNASKLSKQMQKHAGEELEEKELGGKYPGNDDMMISTGSTLLDLAISGGRKRGGGIPAGIFVEVFGPSSSGKTVLLCEIAGGVQRAGGQIMFKDPEARLDKQFARIFDMEVDDIDYDTPDTVPEVFTPVREWEPDNPDVINGIFADSLAALSTDMEMDDKDKYGMRRAKEFSEQLRVTCRILANKNFLMVGSNQLRTNANAGPFGRQTQSPGGYALEYYASLRLRFVYSKKIKKKKKIKGKVHERVIGIETEIEVDKSSVWKPYNTAPITILFDYGIDDISANLQFIKDHTSHSYYTLGGEKLHRTQSKAARMIESKGKGAVLQLREEVIDLWEEIQEQFKSKRKAKPRFQ